LKQKHCSDVSECTTHAVHATDLLRFIYLHKTAAVHVIRF